MALAPRSSLRSLMPLMSHGKPRLSSFFSSSAVATGVPPAAPGAIDTPPAVQPPAPPGRSCPKLPVEEFVHHPIPGGPRSRPRKACLNAPQDPSRAYPAPDHGSRRTCEPVSDGIFEDPRHPVPDPSTMAVTSEPAFTTPGYGSCITPEPMSDKPPCSTSEDVKQRDVDPSPPAREGVRHPVVDPPRKGRRAETDEPARCTQEHPKYPVPDSSSDKVSFRSSAVPPRSAGTCSTPSAPDVQPPALPDRSSRKLPVPEEAVIHPVPDP